MMTHFRSEPALIMAAVVALLGLWLEPWLHGLNQAASLMVALFLVGVIIMVSLRVAHHAEVLAEKVGEPFGTMILTLSAVLVEVVILGIMIMPASGHGPASPTLVRDTIYSAVMLDINGILGLCALLGGLKHGEQPYNADSGNSYIVMIMTALGVSMVLPEFIPNAHWQSYSLFCIVIMGLLYLSFLRLQTHQHSYFFSYSYAETGQTHNHSHPGGGLGSGLILGLGILLIGILAEIMSGSLSKGLEGSNLPPIISALTVATISASPEILTALRAALSNRMQPVVNIALGASLSTVVLTVPVMEALSLWQHQRLIMALTPTQMAMLSLTLVIGAINLNDGETNAIEGSVHFVLFAAFLMLSLIGL